MELLAKHASGEALFMEASREFSRTPRRLHPCSDVSVLQKAHMSHFWDTHHRFTSRQILNYPADEIPTRSVCAPLSRRYAQKKYAQLRSQKSCLTTPGGRRAPSTWALCTYFERVK